MTPRTTDRTTTDDENTVLIEDLTGYRAAYDNVQESYNCRTFGSDVFSTGALGFITVMSMGMGAGLGAEMGLLGSAFNAFPAIFNAGIGGMAGAAGAVISAAGDMNTGCYMASAALINGGVFAIFSAAAMQVVGPPLTAGSGAILGSVVAGTATLVTSLGFPRCSDRSFFNPDDSILKLGRRMFGLYKPQPQAAVDAQTELQLTNTRLR